MLFELSGFLLLVLESQHDILTFSGLNLVVAAVLCDSVCVIAALRGRLLCVMLYSLCKVERIVLTELNEDYYYYYYFSCGCSCGYSYS